MTTIRAGLMALIAGTCVAVGSPLALAGGMEARVEAAEAAAVGDVLPIKRITLYRSGVGAFQREGVVEGDRRVAMKFETGQINDILKTMVLLDRDGGSFGAVSYGSKEPLERRLAGFEINLNSAVTIDELFRQLRGARIKVSTAGNQAEGTILGVESRATIVPNAAGEKTTQMEWYVNLVTATGVRSFSIPQVVSFELSDPRLAEELNLALAAMAEQRAERVKSVELSLNGPAGKARRVSVAYVHEMPVWKASYRLVLGEGAKGGGAVMQGWAIVENTTDTDWEGVTLSLASGRPVSFTMDLYEPIFGERPSVPVPVMGGLRPRVFEDAMRSLQVAGAPAAAVAPGSMVANQMMGEMRARSDMSASRKAGRDEAKEIGGALMFGAELAESAAGSAQASGAEAGEQFMYTVSAPVTIGRQRSAMIPIIGSEVQSKRVSIYNRADGLKNPMRGAWLNNTSGLHLMPGPVAVYDEGTYAGDAQIPHTGRGATRLLAYALDLDCGARSEVTQEHSVVRLSVRNGMILQRVVQKTLTSYWFENRDTKRERAVIVEHARTPGQELQEPSKPVETTDALYRFEVPVPADTSGELKVVEAQTMYESMGVTSMSLETLLEYGKTGKASPAVVEAVKKAAAMQGEINVTQGQLSELDQELKAIAADQSRVRENMSRIDRNSDLYTRYMKKLEEQETRVEQVTAQAGKLRETLRRQQGALEQYLGALNVE